MRNWFLITLLSNICISPIRESNSNLSPTRMINFPYAPISPSHICEINWASRSNGQFILTSEIRTSQQLSPKQNTERLNLRCIIASPIHILTSVRSYQNSEESEITREFNLKISSLSGWVIKGHTNHHHPRTWFFMNAPGDRKFIVFTFLRHPS